MDVVTLKAQTLVSYETSLEFIQIDPDLLVYRLTETPRLQEQSGDEEFKRAGGLLKASVREGFCNNEQRMLAEKGQVFSSLDLQWFPEEITQLAQTEGWSVYEKKREEFQKDLRVCGQNKGIFERFLQDGINVKHNVVRVDYSSHMLYDRLNEVLPVAVYFDQMHCCVTDKEYDLVKSAWHLLNRPDVKVLHSRPDRYAKAVQYAQMVDEAICPVSNYSSDDESKKTIVFMWMASLEDYRKMWNVLGRKKGGYPSTRIREMVLELDLLGLKEAGCLVTKPAKKPKHT